MTYHNILIGLNEFVIKKIPLFGTHNLDTGKIKISDIEWSNMTVGKLKKRQGHSKDLNSIKLSMSN